MTYRRTLVTILFVCLYCEDSSGQSSKENELLNNIFCESNLTPKEPIKYWLETVSNFKSKTFASHLNISETCATQIKWFFENLESGAEDEERWALKMIDATTKIPSGIMKLNLGGWMGDYDECIEIRSQKKNIRGNYCLATLMISVTDPLEFLSDPEKVTMNLFAEKKSSFQNAYPTLTHPSLGICIPDGCDVSDLTIFALEFNLTAENVTFECQNIDKANPPLTWGALAAISFFVFIIILMAASTAYDVYCEKLIKEPIVPLKAFSVYTNSRKLFSTNHNPAELSCLNGVRVLSMIWVVIGHTLSVTLLGPVVNILDVLQYLDTTKSMVFVSAVHSVDTFLMITGLLVIYKYLESRNKNIPFNIFIFYIHRYVRLTTAYAPVVLVSATLLKYMGSGPHWSFITNFFQGFCQDNWWSSLSYFQNYINVEQWCVGQTWYLNIDWQLYLLSPIFLWPLSKKPKVGLSMLFTALVIFLIVPFYVTWVNELPALSTNLNGDITGYQNKYYLITHTRASSWFVGAFVGYAIAYVKFHKTEFKMNPSVLLMIWAAVLAILNMCVFMGNKGLRSKEYHKYSNAFYNSLVRPVWAACVGWIVFACTTGHGGIINSFLSLPAFQVLNRFIYSIYLLHVTMLYMIIYSSKMPAYFSFFNVAYSFWGIFMLTLVLSVFWVLAFESPFICIEKWVLGKIASRKNEVRSNNKTQNTVEHKTVPANADVLCKSTRLDIIERNASDMATNNSTNLDITDLSNHSLGSHHMESPENSMIVNTAESTNWRMSPDINGVTKSRISRDIS